MTELTRQSLKSVLEQHRITLAFHLRDFTSDGHHCVMLKSSEKQFAAVCNVAKFCGEKKPDLADVFQAVFDDFNIDASCSRDTPKLFLDGRSSLTFLAKKITRKSPIS